MIEIRLLAVLLTCPVVAGCTKLEPSLPPEDMSVAVSKREAPEGAWMALWDGESLDGWSKLGTGTWKIQDGLLIGTHDAEDAFFGHLVSDSLYDDFLLRLVFKILRGNSGFYFRSVLDEQEDISGLQAEIAADFGTGGLWETNGRGWVVLPQADSVATWFKPDDWNVMIIEAVGKEVAVWVNGTQSASFRDDDPRFAGWQRGHFAIQLHASQDVEVQVAAIAIATP